MKSGCIVVEQTSPLPDSMHMDMEAELFSPSWKIVNGVHSYGLDLKMHRIGWIFAYAAPSVKGSGIGFGLRRAMGAAFERILSKASNAKFNCLEIRQFTTKTFLGFTAVTIAAHPSNLCPSRFR